MIADGQLDRLIDDIAQLASSLLDVESVPGAAPANPAGSLDNALQQLEAHCVELSLQGAAYVFRLLRKVDPRRQPGALSASDAACMAEWVGDLIAYVMGQTSPADSATVIDHLLPLSWIPALSEDLVHLVRERLARDAERLIQAQAATGDSAATDSPDTVAEPATELPATSMRHSADSLIANGAAANDVAATAHAVAEDSTPAIGEESTASTIEAGGEIGAGGGMDAGFGIGDEPGIELESGSEAESATDQDAELGIHSEPDTEDRVSWVAPEELELVIEAVLAQLLPLAAEVEAHGEHAAQQQALADYREQFELIGAAAEALNLPGLRGVCAVFAAAQDCFVSDHQLLDADQLRLLGEWPLLLVGYLQAPTDTASATDLVTLLQLPDAPWYLPEDEAQALIAQLNQVAVGNDPALLAARKTIAEPQDVALDIAEDVLPTVLAGMLLELPGRSAEFSTRIQKYVRAGTAADLDAAQRIAHTLKGDGNIVGVRGIANLTHALEEILIDLSAAPGVPTQELGEVLIESADCLEAMSDFVLRRGPAPTNAIEVLQSVLNWANALHGDSSPATQAPAAAEPATQALPETATVAVAEEPVELVPEQTISVSTQLLDQLLRLTGEAVIYARQIENRVERIGQRAAEIAVQNQSLQGLVGELQQLVEVRGAAVGSMRLTLGEEFDALEMDRYNELHTVTLRLVEASADTRTTSGDVSQDVVSLRDLLSLQDRIHLDLQGRVLKTRTMPIAGLLPRLQRVVRQTARQLGKECEITFLGETTELDHEIIDRLAEPLVHMLRNAVDHGIEHPEQRVESGKSYQGHIELEFRRDSGVVRIHCRDDGKGLDIQAIRNKGIERGFLTADQPWSDEQVSQLIFRPGFSTRGVATQTSGRGIGMDIVHRCIAALKGSLALHSEQGKGCHFEIQLPASQVVADVLMAQASAATVAIMLHGVERLAAVDSGGLSERAGERVARIGEDTFPVYSLETLLGYPERTAAAAEVHTALIARAGASGSAAVLVGRLGEARSVIVKNLGACVPPMPGVLGATILGDGGIAPVVDLQELIGIHRRLAQATTDMPLDVAEVAPHVLIVDDSLSVRRSLEQLVGDAGFDVLTARDGLEAVERVQTRRPDLILVDMEMPRMNGLELTSFIRKNPATQTVPVIMITSRTTERHRDLARQVGVDMVLSKPYSEEELLRLIETHIGDSIPA